MTRREFLHELRSALSGRFPKKTVEENIEFYAAYIKEEVQKGRDEEEVLQTLGDPRLIAHTIIDVPRVGKKRFSGKKSKKSSGEDRFGFQITSWKKVGIIAGAILFFLLFMTAVRAFLRFALPIALPALAIFAIVKILRKK